jgi:hypothetical protein
MSSSQRAVGRRRVSRDADLPQLVRSLKAIELADPILGEP